MVRVTKMTGSSSDDWILLALRLQVLLITHKYNAIAILDTQALIISVSTSRLLATDLNTETITSNHYEVFLPLLQSPWNSDPILRF
jgi:hypothetical protein